ncbi:hypothetical protein PG996_015073 [Apiospora saccharicola]|uniref:Uncharacterized protein n=1 Tax=Apiospora saccharicola TaxID=335842 RepID=A0ABR1TK37_9PEZI
MANFPSFGLTLEEKSSLVVDVDALVSEAHDKLAQTPHLTDCDYEEALRILDKVDLLAKDCLQDDDEDEKEDDLGYFSSTAKAPRRRSLNQSLAEASVLRGDILRTLNDIPEARKAYTEAISRYPDDFPPHDAHAALTSSSSSRRPSLITRPSSSPVASMTTNMTVKRSVRRHREPVPPPNAATRAWNAILELSGSTSNTAVADTARRNSTPVNNNHATTSKQEKRRAVMWSAGTYEPSTPVTETADKSLYQQMQNLPVQIVGARKQVSIVERSDNPASDISASSTAMSGRGIQKKKKSSDLRALRS